MRRAACALLTLAVMCLPVAAFAQIAPPAPGVEMPQAYYDRIAEDPNAFQFQKAWIQKAQRAKKARQNMEEMMAQGMTRSSIPDEILQRATVAGTVRVPVIVIDYTDVSAPFTTTQLDNQLFTSNPNGTMTQMYTEMSYGNVTLTGDVLGWVNGSSTGVFYEGGCNGLCGGAKTGQLILEALQGVNPTTDFGQYDNDGPDGLPNSGDDDGFVDFIAIVHPEAGGECGGPNMWSHRWVVGGWPEFGAGGGFFGPPWDSGDARTGGGTIQIFDYTVQPIKGSVTGCGAGLIEIGVFAHEFGHAFGLPDLYDTNGGGQGIGEHGLMGSGNWQNPPNPQHMSPWSKAQLGWINPTEVGPTLQTYNIQNAHTNDDFYKLNIYEEKFNRKTFTPIAGTASLHCGLPTGPANARNWPGGSGYGNNWDEAVERTFGYDGSNPVTLEYDAAWNTEASYDFGLVKIEVNGTQTTLASYDGNGSVADQTQDLTPFLNGSGATSYKIIFQFTSDVGYSDEDGLYNSTTNGPFKLDNVSVSGGGETYFADFEVNESGFCYARDPKEYFYVENRNSASGLFGNNVHGNGLHVWHIEENVAGNTSSNTANSTANLIPAKVTLETADGLNQLLLGNNRGDAGDIYTAGQTFDNVTNPNSKSYNNFATNVVLTNIGASGTTMAADMRAGRFAPTLSSVSPTSGDNNLIVDITDIVGTWMYKGGTFCLRLAGSDFPSASVEWTAKTLTGGTIDLNGLAAGVYDFVWKGPDGQEVVLAAAFTVNDVATGIGDTPTTLANALKQNYPNPFNPTTTINYSIQERGLVKLRIFNAAGQLVRTLVNDVQTPRVGGYSLVWDGRSDAGAPVASGVYMYRLEAKNFQAVRKLVLLK